MLETRQELKEFLEYEEPLYMNRMGGGKYQNFLRIVKGNPDYYAWKYQKALRICGYYYANRRKNLYYSIMYLLTCRRKDRLGRLLGIEMSEKNCGKGLSIEHTQGIVINGKAIIGEDFILHGNNCVGVDGHSMDVPVIGNDVRMGVGAKIIGGVRIADHVTIAAGAVVVKSCEEEYAVLAGVPAKIVKYNKPGEYKTLREERTGKVNN